MQLRKHSTLFLILMMKFYTEELLVSKLNKLPKAPIRQLGKTQCVLVVWRTFQARLEDKDNQ